MVLREMFVNGFTESFKEGFFGGMLGAVVALGILIAILIFAAIYIYQAWAWYTIASRMRHKSPWLAWIPFANVAMILQLGGFHWAWIFLIIIPILGWIALLILFIIANWRVFQKCRYPGWFSLSAVIPKVGLILYLVAIGFVAWKPKRRA